MQPETRYAITPDGVYLGYQTLGAGPIDFVFQDDWPGNVELLWDEPLVGPWLRGLATYGRVIMHDHRGIGMSSRDVAIPDIETRAADLGEVLRAAGSEYPVLMGVFASGAVNALYAAIHPSEVRALVWVEPNPRVLWAPDYPWGAGPDYHASEQRTLEVWGTDDYGRAHVEHEAAFGNAQPRDPASLEFVSRRARNACTPDVAKALSAVWYATDVREILPTVRCPTLLLHRGGSDRAEVEYVASLLPDAQIREFAEGPWTAEMISSQLPLIREFLGVKPPRVAPESTLAAVLFTDIVGSTAKQAEVGDAAWKQLLEQHHAVVRTELERWEGSEVDTAGDGFYATFAGPARAVRCALAIGDGVKELGLGVRAGVHMGECTVIDGHLGGLPVTIGARIAALAGDSEVLVSRTVKDLVPGSGLVFEDAGEHELKGVPERWHLYRVIG